MNSTQFRIGLGGEPTGEIRIESPDRASGYFTTRTDDLSVNARTAGVYLRADSEDCLSILDGRDDQKRAELIAEQLRHWKSIKTT